MALTLSAAFTREVQKAVSTPAFLVNIGGLTGGKFVKAPRNVLGYPASVRSINTQSSSIDPVTGEQTLSSITIEFIDDGAVRALAAANRLIGKDLTVTLGFDTGSDSTFAEVDYAAFTTGIIERVEFTPTTISIIAKDTRSAIWAQLDSAQCLALVGVQSVDAPLVGQYSAEGCAPVALKQLLLDAGIPSSWLSASTFTAANCPATGHLVVDRRRLPDANNYHHWTSGSTANYPGAAASDRRVSKQTPASSLVNGIIRVLRGHLLVQEGGLLEYREHDPAASATFRFTKTDIIPGSVKGWLDQANVITSAQVHSFFETVHAPTGDNYRVALRDDDSGAQADWAWTDSTARLAEFTLDDDWFSSEIQRDPHAAANILVGDTTITDIVRENDNFTGQGKNSPSAVSASLPMYLLLDGDYPANAILPAEIVKVTGVTTNADGSFTFTGITRGMFGTTARQHGAKGSTYNGLTQLNSYVTIVDITAIVRCVDQTLQQFKDGAPVIEFKTPLHTFGTQVADVGYVENDAFLSYGLNGLAVGNTTKLKVLQKDTDPDANEITWRMIRLNAPTRTPSIPKPVFRPLGGWGDRGITPPDFGRTIKGGFGATAGELEPHFSSGVGPATNAASLAYSIGEHIVATDAGLVVIPRQDKTATASKDTYLDARPLARGLASWVVTEVANGAGAPAVASGDMRAYKIVSNGTGITVTDLRTSTMVHGSRNIVDDTITNAKVNSAAGILGSKLAAGSGALATLDNSGNLDFSATHTNKHLDNIPDKVGGTYARPVAAALSSGKVNLTAGSSGFANRLPAPQIGVAAVTPEHYTPEAAFTGNLIPNANFSSFTAGTGSPPDAWSVTSGSWDSTHAEAVTTPLRSGSYAIHFVTVQSRGTTTKLTSAAFPVIEGHVYMAGYEKYYATAGGATGGRVKMDVNWLDRNKAAISSSSVLELLNPATGSYLRSYLSVTAPANARYATVSIYGVDGTAGASTDDRYVDNVWMFEQTDFGSGFPDEPYSGQRFFRTDRGINYYYDGTRWLSVNEYAYSQVPYSQVPGTGISASSDNYFITPAPSAVGGTTVYITDWVFDVFIGATNSAVSYWTLAIKNQPGTTIKSYATSALSASSGWNRVVSSVNSVQTVATDIYWAIGATKAGATGLPSNINLVNTIHYRLIG